MLVIQLKPGEGATIGDNIKLWNREGAMVKIAIEAPRDINIVRDSAKKKDPK